MAIYTLVRYEFAEKTYDLPALALWTEMLREWANDLAPQRPSDCSCRCEARVHGLPRAEIPKFRQRLAASLPTAQFDVVDADELTVAGPERSTEGHADISVWRAILLDPAASSTYVLFRFIVEGTFAAFNGRPALGRATFVWCGAPKEGALLVKAIWRVGFDESMGLVYQSARSHIEPLLIEAFDLYRLNLERHPHEAARFALGVMGKERKNLFVARRDEKRIMRLIRKRAELPDDRGPAAFAWRAGRPLAIAILCVTGSLFLYRYLHLGTLGLVVIGMFEIVATATILGKKALRVRRYYKAMRAGLGKLYSGPVSYRQINLSADLTPTLLKCSAEFLALGATHVCDICITSAKGVLDGNRIFWIGNSAVAVGMLRTTEKIKFFPAKPVLLLTTRFTDGSRHYSVNQPRFRKKVLKHVSGRCLLTPGGPAEVLDLHRKHIDKMITAGKVPCSPEKDVASTLLRLNEAHEESRRAWQQSPYSWGDALHDAFKVCRKEFLAD